MASTTPTHVATSIPIKYANRVLRDIAKDTYWDKFRFAGAIVRQDEVENKPGETIKIQVTAPLTGAGVEELVQLEGAEENLTTAELEITPTYRRHGVRMYRRAQKKSMLNLREEARTRLTEWGRTKLDTIRFVTFTDIVNNDGYPANSPEVRYIGGGANIDAILLANVATLAEVSKSKYIALDNGAMPFTIDGKDYLAFVVDKWVEYSLKVTDTSYAQAQREAGIRGTSNPLFTGAEAVWDGLVIHKAERVPAANNAGGIRCAKNLLFGREAFIEAFGGGQSWVEKTFDYDNELGVAYGFDYGCKRGFEVRSMQIACSAPVQS